jgi:hypothetical protein
MPGMRYCHTGHLVLIGIEVKASVGLRYIVFFSSAFAGAGAAAGVPW